MMWPFKKKDPRANHEFDAKDRELAAERRRLNLDIENMKKQQQMAELRMEHQLRMMQLQEDLEEYLPDEDDEESDLEQQMARRFFDRILPPEGAPAAGGVTVEKRYTDAELEAKLAQVSPQHRAMAKACIPEQVSEFIKKRVLLDADADSVSRATLLVGK